MNFNNTTDYLFLPEHYSAKKHLTADTLVFGCVIVGLGAVALLLAKFGLGVSLVGAVSVFVAVFYFLLLVFKLAAVLYGFSAKFIDFSGTEIARLKDSELPTYTILIPLYREEGVIRQIVKAMTAIDYPVSKLDIIITLEEYDTPTIEAIKRVKLPRHMRTLILPNVQPKTKPKALNVAFLQTKGEFLVIYDAEIIPDPDQLKKAVLAFRKFPSIGCLQTRLDHYNARQNWITRLFNAEFSFYYDLLLPGLQKIGSPLPLSGHSTHFRRELLERIGAWDPYNVTEDCDIGIRLYRIGYKTGVLNSLSREEATTTLSSWIMQRTRWMKGFMQTSIVHLRHPVRFKREIGGWKNLLVFLLMVPFMVLANVLNLFLWVLLTVWFSTHSPYIQALFPGVILYVSVVSFVVGNFIFLYLNAIGSYKRGRYDLVKYSLLSPLYWLMLSTATVRAMVQMVTKPHHWEKTKHGTHLTALTLPSGHTLRPARLATVKERVGA